ncbi:MAG: UpxY family transcription antiterminator [Bacteroidota bacterium]
MELSREVNKWYLLYTAPRAEKKVNIELSKKGFTTFLPLQKKLVQWSDRKKWIENPLFNSYIFVFTALSKYYELLNTTGIVKFVSLQGVPVEVSQQQIDLVKLMVSSYQDIEAVEEFIAPGQKIKIIAGPLIGQEGELVEYKSQKRVLIRVNNIGFSILVQVPNNILRKTLQTT